MPLARESRNADASGADMAAHFALVVLAVGGLYFLVLFLIAR
jgi:hypothetical protein